MKNYDDIINLEHHVSKKYPHMNRLERAAQFAPFAALTGYDDAVKETARMTNKKIELTDEMKMIINDKLNVLDKNILNKPEATFTYFVPDDKKSGGTYVTVTGNLKQIDVLNNLIILGNKKKIKINDLIGISGI